ncbi:ankyrin [Lojkania enalia]|uniref:Ankyrin n=1 Tax=Lojkania enalia TaxID=147567 RepID=A0A9P4N7C6_9PLEO|nr:ankyrin [Didymosphaeria enalia]
MTVRKNHFPDLLNLEGNYMIPNGADVCARTPYGRTILHLLFGSLTVEECHMTKGGKKAEYETDEYDNTEDSEQDQISESGDSIEDSENIENNKQGRISEGSQNSDEGESSGEMKMAERQRMRNLICRHIYCPSVGRIPRYRADINAEVYEGRTPLYFAAENSIPGGLDIHLSRNMDVHIVDIDGNTPLHFIVLSTEYSVVEYYKRNTPLHNSVFRREPAVVDRLLYYGAAVNSVNMKVLTPLDITKLRCSEEKIEAKQVLLTKHDGLVAAELKVGKATMNPSELRSLLSDSGLFKSGQSVSQSL